MRLILNDGTVIEGGEAGLSSNGNLWLWFTGYSIMQAAMMFFDPEKTNRITFNQPGDVNTVYEGYTNCTSISIENNGQLSVCLKRED